MPPNKRKIPTPNDIPPDKWCDFRIDYESGMSLNQIAEKYFCDSRTVRAAIIQNRSSDSLGRRNAPTKLSSYEDRITSLLSRNNNYRSIHQMSMEITKQLRNAGYSGSERTVRNYLARTPYAQACVSKTLNPPIERG